MKWKEKNNSSRADRISVDVQEWPSCSLHQCFMYRAFFCLKLSMPPQCRGTTQEDLFIWLLPSKLPCSLDRWPLCPSSRSAVSLSGTKQLEGQLCGYSNYSPSLFLLVFTLSFPPSISSSCPLLSAKISPAPPLRFFSCCSSDANVASDLRQFNLGSGSVLECICLHYAWVRLQPCDDKRG